MRFGDGSCIKRINTVSSSEDGLTDLMLGVASAKAITSKVMPEQMMPRKSLSICGNRVRASQFYPRSNSSTSIQCFEGNDTADLPVRYRPEPFFLINRNIRLRRA